MRKLPTFYYLTHFTEFLAFITGPCASLLNDQQRQFIKQFESLSHDQQCLVVRAINRKNPYIRRQSLYYEEINDTAQHLQYLQDNKWFTELSAEHVHTFVSTLTKTELCSLLAEHVSVKSTANKATLLEHAQQLEAQAILNSPLIDDYVQRNYDDYINYFLYLYFGNCDAKLNQLSMRDLGIMRSRQEQAQLVARFGSQQEAWSTYSLHCQLKQLHNQQQLNEAQLTHILDHLPTAKGERAARLYAKCRYQIAVLLMPFAAPQALEILFDTDNAQAQEKWVRESYKTGNTEAVERHLEKLIDQPIDDESLAFAQDFLARKFHKKRTSVLTDMLRDNSQTLHIDEMHKGAVEKGVVAYYKQQGARSARCENPLWRSLFGLFFWQELFEIPGLGLINEFDNLPNCLRNNNFYAKAQAQIENKLHSIETTQALIKVLSQNAAQHYGKSNGVFRWKRDILGLLMPLLENSPVTNLLAHLRSMSQDWKGLSDGYPDIYVIDQQGMRFEEVKSEGDQLRRNQLTTIQKLKEHGFDVRITNVQWTIDPMQAYAVVDIETTGGRAQQHRITEIGIVKIVNGEVVDSWQTLINPERRIPANITALTGIDNDMVSTAPLFHEIADQLEQFTEGCVFVAHNVNFDYSFIREEFARIERNYKRPKLCTVSQMRKYYKGLSSYSLANLTRHFGIDMQRHHRAMSDALAAAELLNMVNEQRMQYQSEVK